MTIGDKRAFKNSNKVFKIVAERQDNNGIWQETIKFYDERETYELTHSELCEASRELTEEEEKKYKER